MCGMMASMSKNILLYLLGVESFQFLFTNYLSSLKFKIYSVETESLHCLAGMTKYKTAV